MVAGRQAARLHRQLRGREPHLRGRCRYGQVGAGLEDGAARDARHADRLDGRRQERGRGVAPRWPEAGAQEAGDRHRTAGPHLDGRHQGPRAQLRQPPERTVRRRAPRVLRNGAARVYRCEDEAREEDRHARHDHGGGRLARRAVLPRHHDAEAVLVHHAVLELRHHGRTLGRHGQGALADRQAPAPTGQ